MKLEIRNLTKAFGGVHAIEDVTLSFESGSLSAVIMSCFEYIKRKTCVLFSWTLTAC